MPSVASVSEIAAQYGITLPAEVPAFVNGSPRSVDAAHLLPRECPATEEPLWSLQESSPDVVDEAVTAARRIMDDSPWPRLPHAERKRVLRRIMDVLERHREELAAIQSLEVGLPLGGVKAMHMTRTIENFDFFAEVAGTVGGHTYTQTGAYLTVVTREPAGVVALLSPWNAPLVLTSMKLAASLALGNACVIKASEHSPYSVYRFVEVLHEADLPPGLVNLVNGRGPVTGASLVEHQGVDVVGFVGGSKTGAAIMAAAANGVRKVGLELGGKSANMVMASADLEQAIDGSLLAILTGNGQQCLAGSRILVEDSVADEFIERFVKRLSQIRVGDPFDARTEVGAMAFREHFDKVLSYVDTATGEGARLLTGGAAAPGFDKGFFFQPTAVEVGDNRLRVCQEEIFGPFVTIQRVPDADTAIRIANDSAFGLVSYIWSNDLLEVTRMSADIKAGTVWVNTPLARDLRAPFGGYKQSGVGRDGLESSVELLTEEKTVMFPTSKLDLPKLGLGGD